MTYALRLAALLSFALLLACFSHGQIQTQVQTGTPQFGSFGGGPFDTVNLGNSNVHFTIPVFSRAGRGIPFYYNLQYDTSIWYAVGSSGNQSWQPIQNWGLLAQTAVATGELITEHYPYDCYTYISLNHTWVLTGHRDTYYWDYYVDPWGIQHAFPAGTSSQSAWGSCSGVSYTQWNSGTVTTTDGSGYTFWTTNYSTPNLKSRDGAAINAPQNVSTGAGTFTDRNGNQVTVDASGHFTDTLGTIALTVSGSNPMNFTYTAPSGASPVFKLNYTNYTIATNFGISGIHEYKSSGPVPLVTSAVLADGSQYTFNYESTPSTPSAGACTPYSGTTCVTARLTSVTLPTGGQITYSYTGGNNGIYSDGTVPTLTRGTPDGSWQYTRTQISGAHWQTKMTSPNDPSNTGSVGNDTVIDFQKDSGATTNFYETYRQVFQGSSSSGTLLFANTTCYNNNSSNCPTTAVTSPITQRRTNPQFGGSSTQSFQSANYNTYGLPTEQDDYDWSTGSMVLLRKTLITYASLGNGIVSMPSSIKIQDSGSVTKAETDINYDETSVTANTGATPQHVSISGSRGNPTTIKKLSQGSTFINTTVAYFDTGTIKSTTDPLGTTTTYNYPDATSTCGNAFPTSINEPLSLTRSMTWNCTGGVQATSVDENNQPTTFVYNDPYFWRAAEVDFPDGGQTTFTYNSPTSTTIKRKMDNTPRYIVGTTLLDSLGRTRETQLYSDPQGVDYTDTTYDFMGRVASVSNPYRSTSDPTYGITSYSYDALSRPMKIIPPDGSSSANNVGITYSTNSTTVTDQAGKKRSSSIDGLGRLTQITEDPGGLGYVTSYTYDPLSNITGVTQNGGRGRTFVYDALSRLTSETNPESGTTNYYYTTSGGALCSGTATQVCRRTDARNITTTYSFDALNRLTQKSYSDGVTPAAYYLYDLVNPWGTNYPYNYIGRLSEIETVTGSLQTSAYFHYDSMGRVVMTAECVNCTSSLPAFHTTYAYDLAGDLTSYNTIENGITFTYQYDTAARQTSITSSLVDSQHPATLASSNNFWPTNAMRQVSYGNSVNAATMYNNRLQPCRLNWNLNAVVFNTCSDATPSSTFVEFSYGYNLGSANNGNLASWSSNNQQYFARTYSYDALNRLSSMSDGASAQPCRGLTWTYDAWGNRTDQTVTAGTCNTFHNSVNANNQFVGSPYQYDAAGNMTHDANHSYAYDAENRLISVDGGSTATYTYDALGNRAERVAGSAAVQYIRNLDGQVILEANVVNNGSAIADYIYLGGTFVAEYASSTTYFPHLDHLGSARLITNMGGSTAENIDYLPFGEQLTGGSLTSHKFTGDERDSEANLDHTQFRQYSSSLGRWMTPDPAGLAAVDATNPQSWNRYSYVLNNPLIYVDPSGLIWACVTTPDGIEQCTWYDDDQFTSNMPGGGGGGGGALTMWPCSGFVSQPCGRTPLPPTLDVKSLKAAADANASKRFKQCMEDAHNATLAGQAVDFGSLLSITPGLNDDWLKNLVKDWILLPAVKVGGFKALRHTGGVEVPSLTTGTFTKIPPAGDTVWGATENVIRKGAVPAIAFATLADATVALGCKDMIDFSNPPLLAPIGMPQ